MMIQSVVETTKKILTNDIFHTVCFYLAIILFVLPLTLVHVAAPDFFKALYTGRYIAEFLELPHHSFFTFSEVKAWFPPENFNWLGNLVFYGLYQAGGIPLLQLFRLFILFFYVVMFHAIVGFRITPMILLLLVSLMLGSEQKLLMRNSIFLMPFGALLFWLWNQVRVNGQLSALWGFPLLFLFWGNTHGTFLVGVGLLSLLIFGYFLDDLIHFGRSNGKTIGAFVGMFLSVIFVITFLKPYPDYTILKVGQRVFQHGTDRVTKNLWLPAPSNVKPKVEVEGNDPSPAEPENRENRLEKEMDPGSGTFTDFLIKIRYDVYQTLKHFLQNTVFNREIMKVRGQDFPLDRPRMIYVSSSIVLFLITLGAFAITARHFRLEEFLPFLAASIIGFGYMRTVVLIPLVSTAVLFIKHRRGDFLHIKMGRTAQIAAFMVILIMLGNFYYYVAMYDKRHFTASKDTFGFGRSLIWSDRMPEYILEHYKNEKIYNLYGIGTFLNWKWFGRKKVLMDGKSKAYDPDFFQEVTELSLSEYMEKHDINYVLVPYWQSIAFSALIPAPTYQIVAYDSAFFLFRQVDQKEIKNVKPENVIIYSREEYRDLQISRKLYLSLVGDFIKRYQNKPEWVNVFTSPYQRHKDDLEKKFQGVDVNALPERPPEL